MPWRGPEIEGEFPTLGYLLIDWIEANLVIPDGPQRGQPYRLTDEMWRYMLFRWRLKPDARPHPTRPRPRDGLVHVGAQIRRSQKWGKDPLIATEGCAHALGPVQFDGWDAHGEPVGRPVDTPRVQIAAYSEDQTDNCWKPLLAMLRDGPLINTPGLDVGDTRIKLPGDDGWMEPVTSSANSRLGNPITCALVTEPHLLTERDGGKKMWRAMQRGLDGMGGTWVQATNAWDPTEHSVAQDTAEAGRGNVYLDHVGADLKPLESIADETAVRERIRIKYGDSLRTDTSGWVDEDDIVAAIMARDTGEAQARRYFLDEITVGTRDAINVAKWAAGKQTDDPLRPGEAITLGFDGSRSRDATVLVACRIRDGKLFPLRIWWPELVADTRDEWRIDRLSVDSTVRAAFAAYNVLYLWADPFKWQDYLDIWAGLWPKRVIEVPTNNEVRMDRIIERFTTAHDAGQILHNGHETLTDHAENSALRRGKRKPARDQVEGEQITGRDEDYYLHVTRKHPGRFIDAFIGALLAYAARGQAIEDGALVDDDKPPPPAAVNTAGVPAEHGSIFRPSGRLTI